MTVRKWFVRCNLLRRTNKNAARAPTNIEPTIPPTMAPTFGPLPPDDSGGDDDDELGTSVETVNEVDGTVKFDEKTIESKTKSGPSVREVITNEWFPLAKPRLDWYKENFSTSSPSNLVA